MACWKPWLSALAGAAAGAALVALLPAEALFVRTAAREAALAEASGERWACPMICFIGYRPGPCPVCGMQMTRVTAGELNAEQTRRIGLRTTVVDSGKAVMTVRAHGVADYDHRFTRLVIPRVGGRIVARHDATYGCCVVVHAGTPIIDLYSPELIAAQGELQAALRLGDTALVENLRQRFAGWNLAELADCILRGEPVHEVVTIRSPFEGVVMLEDAEMVNDALAVGREIMPDTPLLRLVDPDKRVLVLQVPEHRARWLREGQRVLIESDGFGLLPQLEARVDRLALEVNPVLRTREVRIFLDGAGALLPPGALVAARIQAALGPDLQPADPDRPATWGTFTLVPKTAVLSTGVRHVAWKVAERTRDGRIRFELAPLALGPRLEDAAGNDLFVVRAGLAPGDEVATQGAFLIDSQAQLAGTPSLIFPLGATAPAAGHSH